jgi:hypothetical protein
MDDPLFVWAAQQIAKHPLDPYGFSVHWYETPMRMSEVTMNPPGASYYMAAAAWVAGWSETALHFAFFLPALAAALGTYSVARRFTQRPLLAAAATVLTPAFLVSSSNVMCDTPMLALWVLALMAWLAAYDRGRPLLLFCASITIALCALTKYFGIAAIPLLAVYSIARSRRASPQLLFLGIPVLILMLYEQGGRELYGHGLLSEAMHYGKAHPFTLAGVAAKTLTGLSFAGGCALPALAFIPLLWSRRGLLWGAVLAGAAALWLGTREETQSFLQLGPFISGGISLTALAVSDFRFRKDADSAFLGMWVAGTLAFSAYVNWTVNARSLLPLVPAAGILLARRIDRRGPFGTGAALALAGAMALWVCGADYRLANSAREAAQYFASRSGANRSNLSFEGHWGFQYYMQRAGFGPVSLDSYRAEPGNEIVLPENNTNVNDPAPELVASQTTVDFETNVGIATAALDAGFYSDLYGPMPFAFGRVPPEQYTVVLLRGSGPLREEDSGQEKTPRR